MTRANLLRTVTVIALAAGVLLGGATAAGAHPLGNFTINVYGGIVVRPDEVVVDYVVDLAEIPTYQEQARIDANGDGALASGETAAYRDARCVALARGVTLALDGHALALTPRASAIAFPPGAGGLSLLRLECRLAAPIDPMGGSAKIDYADGNYAGRLGWREVTAVGDGVTLASSDVPEQTVSGRLTAYPKGALPLARTTALLEARPGGPRLETLPQLGAASTATPRSGGGVLAALAGRQDLSAWLVGLMIVVAVGVGALHALGPGHGKGLIGVYLVAGGGTIRQAAAVGAAVSVMHTASVLALGLIVISAERVLPAERVYPWLGLASGLVALGLGSWLLVSRIHVHSHSHDHDHGHDPLSRRGLVALAFSGGILPSPSALVVLLTTISLGRTALGLVLIAAFSIGLAATLVGVGAVALRARALVARRLPTRIVSWAPIASAAAIAAIGVVLTTRGLIQL